MRIGIVGIGGVGGFVGAPLCETYADSDDVEIVFICRGETMDKIRSHGLVFQSGDVTKTVYPSLASDDVAEIGVLDVLIIATKSYSLQNVVEAYREVMGPMTVVIPLQNMVNAKSVIHRTIGDGTGVILEGCIYVTSHIKKPGHIHHVGGPGTVVIGHSDRDRFRNVVDLLSNGGVDVEFREDITRGLWTKYLFLSPVSSVTAAYDVTLGELLSRPDLLTVLEGLMIELRELAEASGVTLKKEAVQASIKMMRNFPPETKTSFQLDFHAGGESEKQFLVDYVLEQCAAFGISTTFYQAVNRKLLGHSDRLH